MYTNIRIKETIAIISLQLQQFHEDTNYIQQTVNSLNTVLQQNYFVYNKEFYSQLEGLPMRSLISPIFSEIFIQYLESQYSAKIKQEFNIIYYCRYVDDIFIIYDNPIDIGDNIANKFNSLQNSISITVEKQTNNNLNYLDLSIKKIKKNRKFELQYKIYRKPTTSKLSINYYSHHSNAQKSANFHFLLNRLNNIPLSKSNYKKEFHNILSIAQFNKFPISKIYNLNRKIKAKINHKNYTNEKVSCKCLEFNKMMKECLFVCRI